MLQEHSLTLTVEELDEIIKESKKVVAAYDKIRAEGDADSLNMTILNSESAF